MERPSHASTRDVEFTSDRDAVDVERAWRWISEESYWARGIALETFRRSIANSLCVSGHGDGAMVAFARVVTDEATFAWLCDVWVDEAWRGLGVGRALVQVALALPSLSDVRRWGLVTRDAHDLYRPAGFVAADPIISMERVAGRAA